MLPDPLILLPQSQFNEEGGESSCEMAWGIPLGPSSLSAPLASSTPAGMDLALTYSLSPPSQQSFLPTG